MARRVKDRNLDSKESRRKLKPRGKPYWRAVERGLHLGYRRRADAAGPWIARHYVGRERYEEEPLGTADDLSDADGVAILDYWQAVSAARGRMIARAHAAVGKTGPYTVADAIADYLDYLDHNRKGAYDVSKRLGAHAIPELGDIEVARLTATMLRKWHADLAKQPARSRTRPGEKQNLRPLGDDDSIRRRRVSANRCLGQLKAALNRAWREGKIPSDEAWRKVEPFKGAEAARVRYLTVAEAQRLLNVCDPDFRLMVRAGLETGARYGEISRLTVADLNLDSGTLAIHVTKTGRPRHVVLTSDGISFFEQACAGRAGADLMFPRSDGSQWGKSHQLRLMRAACERAKITPAIGFHQLRHTWASLAAMNGVPLLVIAKNLGHVDTTMVEKHYGHLAPSYVADAIRAGAPRFGKVSKSVRIYK